MIKNQKEIYLGLCGLKNDLSWKKYQRRRHISRQKNQKIDNKWQIIKTKSEKEWTERYKKKEKACRKNWRICLGLSGMCEKKGACKEKWKQ